MKNADRAKKALRDIVEFASGQLAALEPEEEDADATSGSQSEVKPQPDNDLEERVGRAVRFHLSQTGIGPTTQQIAAYVGESEKAVAKIDDQPVLIFETCAGETFT